MKSGTNLLYQIPLGQGHKLLPDGAAGKIFGGWQLALVNAYNSGSRLAATVPNTLLFFNGGLRPDLVSGNIRRHVSMSDFDPARHLYLNRSAFALPAEGKSGSAPRYLGVRGPARLDESFAVAKNTRIRAPVPYGDPEPAEPRRLRGSRHRHHTGELRQHLKHPDQPAADRVRDEADLLA